MNITKQQFKAYENVRTHGLTNMFAVNTVADMAGLTKEEVIYIMENYNSLYDKYI